MKKYIEIKTFSEILPLKPTNKKSLMDILIISMETAIALIDFIYNSEDFILDILTEKFKEIIT